MTTPIHSIAALLIVGAALATTPALAAAMTPGSQGDGELSINRDAPLTLPGTVTPKPTPMVDAASTRGLFDIDPAAALESLGTVTLNRDGSTDEAPASDALRAIFETSVKGHQAG